MKSGSWFGRESLFSDDRPGHRYIYTGFGDRLCIFDAWNVLVNDLFLTSSPDFATNSTGVHDASTLPSRDAPHSLSAEKALIPQKLVTVPF